MNTETEDIANKWKDEIHRVLESFGTVRDPILTSGKTGIQVCIESAITEALTEKEGELEVCKERRDEG